MNEQELAEIKSYIASTQERISQPQNLANPNKVRHVGVRTLTDLIRCVTEIERLTTENSALRIDKYCLEQALYKEQLYGTPKSERSLLERIHDLEVALDAASRPRP